MDDLNDIIIKQVFAIAIGMAIIELYVHINNLAPFTGSHSKWTTIPMIIACSAVGNIFFFVINLFRK